MQGQVQPSDSFLTKHWKRCSEMPYWRVPLTKFSPYTGSVVFGVWNTETSSVLLAGSAHCWEQRSAGYQLLPSQEEGVSILITCAAPFLFFIFLKAADTICHDISS